MTRKEKKIFGTLSIPERAKFLLKKPITTKVTINHDSTDIEVLAIADGIALPGVYKSGAEAIKKGTALLTRLAGQSPEIRAPRGYYADRKALNLETWRVLKADKLRDINRLWRANNPEKDLEYRKKYYSGWENAKCRRQRWDDIEDCLIMDRSILDSQLSLKLGRSVRAIVLRRVKLNKVNAQEDLALTRQ